jgi:signal transduction histidine kinase
MARSRMLIGAQLEIDTTRGRGTEIKLSIPTRAETP